MIKTSLLIVEDDLEFLEEIAEDLEEHFKVFKAENGRDGLSIVAAEHISIIISDIMMPVMDGLEFCKAIKASPEFCHIPVILLTAKNTMASKIEGLGLGAEAYIGKPFDMDYLIATIGTLLQNRNIVKRFFSPPADQPGDTWVQSLDDLIFMQKPHQIIEDQIDDTEMDTWKLSRLLNMSRTNLFKKIKALTTLTPHDYVNIMRLKRAAEILRTSNTSISQVSQIVGFNSAINFGRSFLKHFGVSPSEFRKHSENGLK